MRTTSVDYDVVGSETRDHYKIALTVIRRSSVYKCWRCWYRPAEEEVVVNPDKITWIKGKNSFLMINTLTSDSVHYATYHFSSAYEANLVSNPVYERDRRVASEGATRASAVGAIHQLPVGAGAIRPPPSPPLENRMGSNRGTLALLLADI